MNALHHAKSYIPLQILSSSDYSNTSCIPYTCIVEQELNGMNVYVQYYF